MATALWRVLVEGAAVGAHLGALRAVSLLGAGDFWQALLLQVRCALCVKECHMAATNAVGRCNG